MVRNYLGATPTCCSTNTCHFFFYETKEILYLLGLTHLLYNAVIKKKKYRTMIKVLFVLTLIEIESEQESDSFLSFPRQPGILV